MNEAYRQYMGSRLWWLRRRWIMERDNHICRHCTVRPATEVHHLTYERFGNEHPGDLIAICDLCHGLVTVVSRAGRRMALPELPRRQKVVR